MHGNGEDYCFGVAYDVRSGDSVGAGGEDGDGQSNVVGWSGSGDGNVVARCDGRAGERGAELSRPDDAEAQIIDRGVRGIRRALGETAYCDGHRQPAIAVAAPSASRVAASSSRTRGMTSRP